MSSRVGGERVTHVHGAVFLDMKANPTTVKTGTSPVAAAMVFPQIVARGGDWPSDLTPGYPWAPPKPGVYLYHVTFSVLLDHETPLEVNVAASERLADASVWAGITDHHKRVHVAHTGVTMLRREPSQVWLTTGRDTSALVSDFRLVLCLLGGSR